MPTKHWVDRCHKYLVSCEISPRKACNGIAVHEVIWSLGVSQFVVRLSSALLPFFESELKDDSCAQAGPLTDALAYCAIINAVATAAATAISEILLSFITIGNAISGL